jgi:ribose transport system ATP-binding protein
VIEQENNQPAPSSPYVELRGITKTFGAEIALDGVSITFSDGEIHGLLGENGSGKSTLIKILAGFHEPDEGQIVVRDTTIDLPMKPGGYREFGFAFVHQDLGLVPSLTVMENLHIERFAAARRSVYIPWRKEEAQARRSLDRFGAPWISPRALIADLPPIDRALVAIARALHDLDPAEGGQAVPGRLLVLDEPTAFLSRAEARQLFTNLRNIAANGTSVLFVSHKLQEVLELTDRTTALRDGRIVGTKLTGSATELDLTTMILGHEQVRSQVKSLDESSRVSGKPLVALRGVRVAGRIDSVDLDIPAGEILGLTGLEGSGFEELVYALFGIPTHRVSGTLEIAGISRPLSKLTPERAMALAIALVPGDRLAQGCVPTLSVRENLVSAVLDTYRSGWHLSWNRINEASRRLADQFDIRPREVRREISTLSGGNQQKVLLAKWLQVKPQILLLHEPTQGVDIGAREQIFDFIRSATGPESCTIIASNDFEQLERLCTRVLIIGDRRVNVDLHAGEISADRIAEECLLSHRSLPSSQGA